MAKKKKKAARATKRVDPNEQLRAGVAQQCRRRCCMCFGLRQSLAEVEGQLAHLDGDRTNTTLENLAYLCLPCHGKFDTKNNRTQGFTVLEIKTYQAELFRALGMHVSEWTITVRAMPSEYDGVKSVLDGVHGTLKTICVDVKLIESKLR